MNFADFARIRSGRRIKRSPPADRSEDGITFDSKAELKRYRELKEIRSSGAIRWFVRQPLFDLAGARYHADFLIVWISGEVTVEEVKGRKYVGAIYTESLRRFKRNAAQVSTLYGVEVELVER